MNEDIIKYIAEHLSIEIDHEVDFGPVDKIKVKLKIGDNVISEDDCILPIADEYVI